MKFYRRPSCQLNYKIIIRVLYTAIFPSIESNYEKLQFQQASSRIDKIKRAAFLYPKFFTMQQDYVRNKVLN